MIWIPSPGPLLPALFSILALALAASAVLVNHTVDDQAVLNPAVLTHTPQVGLDSWIPGQTCTSCLIPPGVIDPSKTYDGTWTYTGQPSTEIVASFTGTAVYVFNILPNTVPSLTATFSNLSFSLDGVDAGQFVRIPDSTPNILYNVSVFTAVNLANAPHVLTITVQGQNACHALFDYLVYTADEPDPQTSSTPSTSINSSSMAQSSGIPSPSIASPEPRTSSTYQMSTAPSAQPQTSSISPTSDTPSIRISLQSDKDAIREQIAELREEFERMTRDRAAERMRNFHEPPPVYEEVQPITRKEDCSSWC